MTTEVAVNAVPINFNINNELTLLAWFFASLALKPRKRFGRPSVLKEEQQLTVIARINAGISISAIAREFNTTRQTILRVKAGQQ